MKNTLRILFVLVLAFAPLLSLISPVSSAPNLAGTPVLIAYDSFTRADGSIGSTETTGPASEILSAYAWTGGAISGNKNVISPTFSGNLLQNGNMESGNPPDYWLQNGTATLTGGADEWTGGSGTQSLYVSSNGVGLANSAKQSISSQPVGTWFQMSGWIKKISGEYVYLQYYDSVSGAALSTNATSWTNRVLVSRITGTSGFVYCLPYLGGTGQAACDDLAFRTITLSSVFSTISSGKSDVVATAKVTLNSGNRAGLVVNLDSQISPNNFVIAYHNGTNIVLEKSVGGTYTTLINTAVTYVPGATIRLEKDGTTYKLFYNGTQRGTDQTITDAGIINNTIHGLLSTDSSNSFDNFYLYDNNPATPTATQTASPTYTATATETQTETPTNTATGTLEPTYTPTNTSTPEPTATATWAPVILPTLNAEEFTLSSGHTFQIERRATFGEVGLMISLLCISVPFGALAFVNYVNKKR
jgi:hypothetical protein